MAGFIEGVDREQIALFPDRLEEWVGGDNPVRVVDAFVDALDLREAGFWRTSAAGTGRPGYHPAVLLKLFIYGYLNRIASSRRLEREAGRNVEVMWLTGRLAPDHKTIADFRKENGAAIRKVCARFVDLCRRVGVLGGGCVAIDGSKFKAVNHRDRNFTPGKVKLRIAHLEESAGRYLAEMDRIDRQEAHRVHATKVARIEEKLARIRQEVRRLEGIAHQLDETPDGQISLTDPDARSMATYGKGMKADFAYDAGTDVYRCPAGKALTYRYTREEDGLMLRRYWQNDCRHCPLKSRCTTGKERRITRWEHEHLVESMYARMEQDPELMTKRRSTVEHPFGTIKAWMGATHFQMRRLRNVRTEMALYVLAYNIKRMIELHGIGPLLHAIRI